MSRIGKKPIPIPTGVTITVEPEVVRVAGPRGDLFERKNRVQSRAALLDDVWGVIADITTRTVDTHVKRLRQKLGPAGDYVETVRGVGYRFADSPQEALR